MDRKNNLCKPQDYFEIIGEKFFTEETFDEIKNAKIKVGFNYYNEEPYHCDYLDFDYDDSFHYPSSGLIRSPTTLTMEDLQELQSLKIKGICNCEGTYGMGGMGLIGFDLGDKKLIYRIWGADRWMVFDGKIFDSVDLYKLHFPITIEHVDCNNNVVTFELVDANGGRHILQTLKSIGNIELDSNYSINKYFCFADPISTIWNPGPSFVMPYIKFER